MSREPSTNGAPLPRGPLVPGPPPDLRPFQGGHDRPGPEARGPEAAAGSARPARERPSPRGAGGNGHPGDGHGEHGPAVAVGRPAAGAPERGGNGVPQADRPGVVTTEDLLAEAGARPPDSGTAGGDGGASGGRPGAGRGTPGGGHDGGNGALELVPTPPPPASAPGGGDLDDDGPADAEEEPPAALRARRLRDLRYQRRFGVAPFIRPSSRRSHRQRRRDYRKLGFIELTQDKAKLRHRVLPRTVIGISTLIAALGVGAAFAGAALYAYYDNRLTENEARVTEFATGFENNYNAAITQIQQQRDQALQSVAAGIERVQEAINDANAMVELPDKVGGGVWLVRTMDAAGRPTMGTAFVVPVEDGDEGASYLLTAHELVAAATAQPGPEVTVEKFSDTITAEVWAWDPDRGLALLKVARPDLPALELAPDEERATVRGSRVYALSGLGGAGTTVSPGNVNDVSDVGLRHNIALSVDFRGGPIVNAAGQVLGVATLAYQPLGFDPGPMPYAPSVDVACKQVLSCPPGLVGTGR